jgi:hypothetical protein
MTAEKSVSRSKQQAWPEGKAANWKEKPSGAPIQRASHALRSPALTLSAEVVGGLEGLRSSQCRRRAENTVRRGMHGTARPCSFLLVDVPRPLSLSRSSLMYSNDVEGRGGELRTKFRTGTLQSPCPSPHRISCSELILRDRRAWAGSDLQRLLLNEAVPAIKTNETPAGSERLMAFLSS